MCVVLCFVVVFFIILKKIFLNLHVYFVSWNKMEIIEWVRDRQINSHYCLVAEMVFLSLGVLSRESLVAKDVFTLFSPEDKTSRAETKMIECCKRSKVTMISQSSILSPMLRGLLFWRKKNIRSKLKFSSCEFFFFSDKVL